MKLSELFGEPVPMVAYSPRLRQLAGSINAGLLLGQLLYWTDKQSDPDGWIFKRSYVAKDDPQGLENPENQSLEFETGLAYKEQFAARAALRSRGFLVERYLRSEHKMAFRLNIQAIRDAWEHMPKGRKACSQKEEGISQKEDGILPTGGSLIGTYIDYSETTAKTDAGVSNREVPLAWKVAHGLKVSEAQLEGERLGDEATAAFESALGVRGWPWGTTRAWEKMVALVAEAWRQDPQIFRRYVEWMEGEGKFKAMSVKQIRLNPRQFIDTGWPLFRASRKPNEPEPVQEETDLMRRMRERKAAK